MVPADISALQRRAEGALLHQPASLSLQLKSVGAERLDTILGALLFLFYANVTLRHH